MEYEIYNKKKKCMDIKKATKHSPFMRKINNICDCKSISKKKKKIFPNLCQPSSVTLIL